MGKWQRVQFLPSTPLGKDGRRVTESKEHIALSREAATEGMVLLKNDNKTLPLKKGSKVVLLGKGTFDYVKGGGGSGDVTVSYIRNLYDGFCEYSDSVSVFPDLVDFYRDNIAEQYKAGREPGMTIEPEIPENLLKKAAAYSDTAIISISRFSGEGWDRKSSFDVKERDIDCGDLGPANNGGEIFPDGDFYLNAGEKAMVKAATENFKKVIVVLNVGGVVDAKWFSQNEKIQSVLLAWQGGMEGGIAAAEILVGKVNPSGKLVDTFAETLEDYPSSLGFHESDDYVEYTEDIYVGYRYFETIPEAYKKVVYPFGYGLSYTTFQLSGVEFEASETETKVFVDVTNTGAVSGKEVVQVYGEAPQGKLGKSKRVLVAFAKTDLLKPGETRRISMSFTDYQLASYDDEGLVSESSYVLEKGIYQFYVGTSVRNAELAPYEMELSEDVILEVLSKKVPPRNMTKRMTATGDYKPVQNEAPVDTDASVLEKLPAAVSDGRFPAIEHQRSFLLWNANPEDKVFKLIDVAEGTCTLDEFVAQLSDRQLMHLVGGQPNVGVADVLGMGNMPEYGIPSIMTADGPAGLRIRVDRGVKTTAWPCATLLACTWNTALVEQVGIYGGEEVKENNIGFWLTPGVNIHRSPLCGRNFEYYSEDPLVAGKMGAAMVRGIQSNGVSVSVKHFALNNKETNRRDSDSRATERAIREIYLKPFEIIVKEADPWTIMSSYNIVNGYRTSECRDLLVGILRDEWNFDGFVTTDWWNKAEHYKELKAGNDVKMGCGYPDRLEAAMKKGEITRTDLETAVKHILNVFLKLD